MKGSKLHRVTQSTGARSVSPSANFGPNTTVAADTDYKRAYQRRAVEYRRTRQSYWHLYNNRQLLSPPNTHLVNPPRAASLAGGPLLSGGLWTPPLVDDGDWRTSSEMRVGPVFSWGNSCSL
ncbi:unnamed protein product [Sphagnum jensenii]|uniref:Uncharacterized protein n=1 Tax=Sphagnum jensenii TaxID=128206 RepID=A0ABP0V8U6_9BRYO